MHTKITLLQFIFWGCTLLGQISVATFSWSRRNLGLATYLSWACLNGIGLFLISQLASVQVYYVAYCVGSGINYVAEFYLTFALFQSIRRTGMPFRRQTPLSQVLLVTLFAVAVIVLPYPAHVHLSQPQWRWFLAAGNSFYEWLSLALAAAPVYAWLIDSAGDRRQLMIYLGFAVYVSVHAGAIDYGLLYHVSAGLLFYAPTLAYLAALIFWAISSLFEPYVHLWDPKQQAALKASILSQYRQLQTYRKVHLP